MLNTTNSNSEYLHNYIRKVAKQEQESVDTSSVYTGTIEAAQSGIYTIVLNQSDKSSSVLAIPIVTGDIYDKDDSVYLLRANTTATVNYFIVGKVNAIQEAFFNLTELERFNPNESKADLSFGDNDFISISENINNIFDSINELGYFQLEVKLTSKVEDGAKIIIYLNYVEDESQYAAKFEFSSYEFIGQPGGVKYTLIQKKIFHLPSSIDIENIRIEKVGDFSVAAMNIVAGSLLEVSAAYQNSIAVQNDKNYFEKDIEIEDDYALPNTVTLTSKVYYNNKPLVGDALQYYWLLKDDNATNSASVDYLDIDGAGNGWRCLNTFTSATTADEEEIRLWDNKNNFIVLNKTNKFVNFSNFVNKVKCIVKYFDNFIESDLIDIYNYDYEQFNAILQSTVDNNILAYKDDKIILQCEVLNDNEKIDNSKYSIEYRWYVKSGNTDESDLNITAKNEKDEEILTYSSLTIYDSAYTNTLQKGEYKLAKGKTEEEFYCVATIIPKGTKEGYHSEQTNVVKVSSNAAAADITQSTEYKYYISNEHNITFRQGIKQEEGQLSEWNGDWEINVAGAIWVGPPVEVDYNTVFSSFDIFNQCKKDEEQFVYYTQRNVWRERGEVFKTENWSFPQIARSVININGWKNHRVGDNVNQLNTFNQLSDNGKEDGIYYADIAKITTDDTPDWGTKYYERNVSPDGEISYTLISLEATIHFKKDKDYYTYNSEKEQYELVLSNVDYNKNNEYYEKINDNEYQKLVVNTQNFDITNVAWPSNKTGPFYTNIDNKLLINASYIRSGTLEVKDKFYASIDQDDVRIGGFLVNNDSLQSLGESPAVILSPEQIKVGEFFQASETGASFKGSVTVVKNPNIQDDLGTQLENMSNEIQQAANFVLIGDNDNVFLTTPYGSNSWNAPTGNPFYTVNLSIWKGSQFIEASDSLEDKIIRLTIQSYTADITNYSTSTSSYTTIESSRWQYNIQKNNINNAITLAIKSRTSFPSVTLPIKIQIQYQDEDGLWTKPYVATLNANQRGEPGNDGNDGKDGIDSIRSVQISPSATIQKRYSSYPESYNYYYKDSSGEWQELDTLTFTWMENGEAINLTQKQILIGTKVIKGINDSSATSTLTIKNDETEKDLLDQIFGQELTFKGNGIFWDAETIKSVEVKPIWEETLVCWANIPNPPSGPTSKPILEFSDGVFSINIDDSDYIWETLSDFFDPELSDQPNKSLGWTGQTNVWKYKVIGYDDGSYTESKITLMPQMDAIKEAASRLIKDNVYIQLDSNNKPDITKFILTNLGQDLDTSFVKVLGEDDGYFVKCEPGDIGRFCLLYGLTCIDGGAIVTGSLDADKIKANSISTNLLKTDVIKSKNYLEKTSTSVFPFSQAGTYLNLENGTLNSKNFHLDGETGTLMLTGKVQSASEISSVDQPVFMGKAIASVSVSVSTPSTRSASGNNIRLTVCPNKTSFSTTISDYWVKRAIEDATGMFPSRFEAKDTLSFTGSILARYTISVSNQSDTNGSMVYDITSLSIDEEGNLTVKGTIGPDGYWREASRTQNISVSSTTFTLNIPLTYLVDQSFVAFSKGKGGILDLGSDAPYLAFPNLLLNSDGLFCTKGNISFLLEAKNSKEEIFISSLGSTKEGLSLQVYGTDIQQEIDITAKGIFKTWLYEYSTSDGEKEYYYYSKQALIQFYDNKLDPTNRGVLCGNWWADSLSVGYSNTYHSPTYEVMLVDGRARFLGNTWFENSVTFNPYSNNSINVYFNNATVYEDNVVINLSDREYKTSIAYDFDQYSLIFDQLKPASFKLKNGTSSRTHLGLIAQEVEEAVLNSGLTTVDFAAICYDINSETGQKEKYGIRYGELISLCIYEIQKNKARIKELEDKLNEIKGDN